MDSSVHVNETTEYYDYSIGYLLLIYCFPGNVPGIIAGTVIGAVALVVIIVTLVLQAKKPKRRWVAV